MMGNSSIKSLSYLDEIPDVLYQQLVTHQYCLPLNDYKNSLHARVKCVLDIRNYLLAGSKIKPALIASWLDEKWSYLICEKLNSQILLDKTFNNESYTNEVLLTILNWIENFTDDISHDKQFIFSEFEFNKQDKIDKSMQEINASFSLERHIGWDLTKGVDFKTDFNTLIECHNFIKSSKKIQSIIRIIGRNKHERLDKYKQVWLNNKFINYPRVNTAIPDDNAVNSVTGVCLGDDVSRILSSELALLSNKKLKMLWHARRAERQLLNYHYQGLLSEHVPEVQTESFNIELKLNIEIQNRGDIILCIDTSASMKGRPELVSKAIAFEVMRIAHLEKRNCYLFCFSGKNEIMKLELNLSNGWQSILNFLCLSFSGGTDINNLMLNVFEKCNETKWKNADILLLTDGCFNIDDELSTKNSSFILPTRFFGVQLGAWGQQSLSALCHKVFDFSDV